MSGIHNRKHLKPLRVALRNNSTSAEATLWIVLKGKQLEGKKFRRKHSIGKYIVDFYCPELQLAIELDGKHHFEVAGEANDVEKDAYLKSLNITVLHFENKLVFKHLDAVLDTIR